MTPLWGDVRGWCCDVFVSDSSRADVCRTAGERVTVKVSADPNLSTTISLVHSTRQLPPSLAPLAESPASLFPLVPPASCASCDNKGKFIWARGAAVLGSPIEISIVLLLFLVRRWVFRLNAFSWSEIADGFLANPMWADFADLFPFFFFFFLLQCWTLCYLVFVIYRSITVRNVQSKWRHESNIYRDCFVTS